MTSHGYAEYTGACLTFKRWANKMNSKTEIRCVCLAIIASLLFATPCNAKKVKERIKQYAGDAVSHVLDHLSEDIFSKKKKEADPILFTFNANLTEEEKRIIMEKLEGKPMRGFLSEFKYRDENTFKDVARSSPPDTEPVNIYIYTQEKQFGPYNETHIIDMIDEGRGSLKDFGWAEGTPAKWERLYELLLK